MTKGFFITGTDTHVGKTVISAALLNLLQQQGYKTLGLKPVASGGNDAEILQMYSSEAASLREINPFYFNQAIAPHLAAKQQNIQLNVKKILAAYQALPQIVNADKIIIEGAGGWLTPLNKKESFVDLVEEFALPVILVVGMRLGCINHALLTMAHNALCKVKIIGWIANCIDPKMAYLEDNINSLKERITAPLLGIIPYQKILSIQKITEKLNRSIVSHFDLSL